MLSAPWADCKHKVKNLKMIRRLSRPLTVSLRHFCSDKVPSLNSLKIEDFQTCQEYMKAALDLHGDKRIDWDNLIPNLVGTLPSYTERSKQLNKLNVDGFVVACLRNHSASKAIYDFINYSKGKGKPISLYVYSCAFKAWGYDADSVFSAKEIEDIRRECQYVMDLPNATEEHKILAAGVIARLGDGKAAFKMYSQHLNENEIKGNAFSTAIIMALKAIESGDLKVFWEIIYSRVFATNSNTLKTSIIESDHLVQKQDKVFTYFIKKYHHDSVAMNELFSYFSKAGYFMTSSVADLIVDLKLGTVRYYAPKCSSCNELLPSPNITKAECLTMLKYISENVVKNKDGEMFHTTMPEEMSNFERYLARSKDLKIDVVIDGLNVSFTYSKKKTMHDKLSGRDLLQVLRSFKEKGLNVLLIHRSWFKTQPNFQEVVNNCHSLFLMEKHSSDDPFAIMAALFFGPYAKICSNDLFRSHRYLLRDREVLACFNKWQCHRSIQFSSVDGIGGRKIALKFPPSYSVFPSKTAKRTVWHLPILPEPKATSLSTNLQTTHVLPDKMLCVQLPHNRFKNMGNRRKAIKSYN